MKYAIAVVVVLVVVVGLLLTIPSLSRVTLSATVETSKPIEQAFAYMADFTTTTEWDPATVVTEKLSGDGGLGSRYRNTTEFNGSRTQLEYVVTDYRLNDRVELRGENNTLSAVDTMTFRKTSTGTRVTYTAEFTFKGVYRLASPFLRGAFGKLEAGALQGLKQHLN